MYAGYLAIDIDDPLTPDVEVAEIVNSPRAYAYARNAAICWLEHCDECPEVGVVTPGGPVYLTPALDPAPWYKSDDPDSAGFLGVVGLEVEGGDSSTRTTSVKIGLTGQGVIGPTYMQPRTLVVRALAIATDECSLQYGLTWLRSQYRVSHDPCGGDPLTFFDCCPCVCEDSAQGGPCWAANYYQLDTGLLPCFEVTTPAQDAYFQTVKEAFAWTDDPGPMPNESTLVWKWRLSDVTGWPVPARQQGSPAPDTQWAWTTYDRIVGPSAVMEYTTDGVWANRLWADTLTTGGAANTDVMRALSQTLNVSGEHVLRSWDFANGAWAPHPSTRHLPTPAVVYDSPHDLQVGVEMINARLYSVELRRGLDPGTGELLWRFDAEDYPGTGTTYTDPRGRTWTIDDPTAFSYGTPPVVEGWWPSTYAELETGPPLDDETWCTWLSTYAHIDSGPPGWSCCVDQCVVPYLRQFKGTRVTEGPTVLNHPDLYSDGAVCEIEFTIVCADPAQYSAPFAASEARWMRGTTVVTDAEPEPVKPDPWKVPVPA